MTTATVKNQRSAAGGPSARNDGDGGGGNGNGSGSGSEDMETTTLSKSDSQEDTWASSGYNYINPFVHRVQIDDRFVLARIYVLTVILLPIRVVGCMISLLSAWMFACIGLYGLTMEDLKKKPISGWRKQLQRFAKAAMRMVYACGSFHHITFKGKPASSKEAPILVVAPHSSYVDSILVVAVGPPTIVAKHETSSIPILGKIINFAQPIYVQREDPNSRQNTIREIVERSRSEDDWPHVLIFAEGTCTNRKALIKFKPGAFYPGVPVQPVLLKYPNRYDTCTWTWDGPGTLRLLWMTMSSFYNRCEIEFLPVYTPSEEEKANANLYAYNVREVMARALDVPTSEYSFEDVIMMSRARDARIPFPGDIVEIEHILFKLGLLESNRDAELAIDFLSINHSDKVDIITFSELLEVDLKNVNLYQLFSLLDHRRIGSVSLKSFLLCSLFCKLKNDEVINFLRAIVRIYSDSSRSISRQNFAKILRHSSKMPPAKYDELFLAIDQSNKGFISFDDFEHYTKDHPKYKFLYKQQEQIRRTFKNPK